MTGTAGPSSPRPDDDDGLRAAMNRATTGLPGNPARFDQVHHRARRRRRLATVGVVAAAVFGVALAGGVPLLILSGDGNGTQPIGPGDGTLTEQTEPTCPDPSGGPGPMEGGDESDPFVADGAVAALLCPVPRDDLEMPANPSDITDITLTKGVDTLVGTLNDLPKASEIEGCHDDLGPTYDLVLAYPDGTRTVVTFEAFGCGTARAKDAGSDGEGKVRVGGQQIANSFERLATAQMSGGSDPSLPCDVEDEYGIAVPETGLVPPGASLARICQPFGQAGQGPTGTSTVTVPDDRLSALLNELPEGPASGGDDGVGPTVCEGGQPLYKLVMGYPDGSIVNVQLVGDGKTTCVSAYHTVENSQGVTTTAVYRLDGDRVLDLMRELLADQYPGEAFPDPLPIEGEPDPGKGGEGGPGEAKPENCPAPSGGPQTSPEAGPDGPLVPDTVTEVLICDGQGNDLGAGDLAGHTITGDPLAELVGYLNGLSAPKPDQPCTLEIGPHFDLVFTTADGDTQVVRAAMGGCGDVESEDRHRVGAKDLGDLLRTLVAEQ